MARVHAAPVTITRINVNEPSNARSPTCALADRRGPVSEPTETVRSYARMQISGTISGVINDLCPMARHVESDIDVERAARMLDNLSRELGEAAQMLRAYGSA